MSISEHKHIPEPVRRIEVFTGAGRRRSWSASEKAAIIAESYGAGETAPEPAITTVSPRRTRRRRSRSDGIELEIAGVEVRVGADAKPRTIEAVIRALKASS